MVTEACKKNHVTVNGQVAKPSKEVFPTDKITFRKDQITQIITVLDIPEKRNTGRGLPTLGIVEIVQRTLSKKRNGKAHQKRPTRY
jgi:ribosomal 50S subunit-recycling heat shock protein